MSVLVIRAHKRFAVCRRARLRRPGRRFEAGLVIELSLDGCRVSNLPLRTLALDQQVTLRIDGAEPIEARVRWLGENTAGLRFVRPLHVAALDALIRLCRSEPDAKLVTAAA